MEVFSLSLSLGSFSCTEVGDGFYPDPSADCSKYIECHDGVMSSRSCAAGLLFNPKIKTCDWPANFNFKFTFTVEMCKVFQ